MGRIGIGEVIIIVGVFVLLFGVKKIPEIANALGKALGEFKKGSRDVEDEVKRAADDSHGKKSN